ncbi:MAG: D-beta-D-heptose 7-phosphate kinase / D-beta-D-heptose 1-phosphate adenosyltransferase [Pseudonocardiales bacterium]|nr:D-beta-D-heptose 7-phosphate kinase / D-beta-D-heptose 1-phosphate adenosyltransferase [Pseudonocardiales bacterium]
MAARTGTPARVTPPTIDSTPPVPPVVAPVPAGLASRIADRAPRVLVLGDALLDGWLSGPAHRIGRDGPVPVVELAESRSTCGGAANTAANLAALGATVDLLTVFGDDGEARTLRDLLADAGVRTGSSVIELGRTTPVKRRLMVAGHQVARYDVAPTAPPRRSTQAALVDALTDALTGDGDRPDAVVLADYGLGALTAAVRERLATLRDGIPLLVVDGRDPLGWGDVSPDVVTPNAAEAAALLGVDEPSRDRPAWAAAHREALLATCGGADVLLTLDVDGVVRLPADPAEPVARTRAHPTSASRACGAGDTFTAAYTVALCADLDPATALAVAQAAADVVVTHEETAVCSTAALTAQLAAADRGGMLEHRDLLAVIAEHRRRGHRIVFTNGCFDVLHRGHVTYLRQARALGDLLVVALNSDDSVARLKGPQRPVNPLADRAGVVGAIECVDLVTAFSDDTPAALIEMVRPEVYAKGGDYTPEMLPETPIVERLGGQVRVLDYLSDHSTTAIVTRIRTTEGAR